MSYEPVTTNAFRRFMIQTQSTMADPAWTIAVTEWFDDGKVRNYPDFKHLKNLIDDLEEARTGQLIRMKVEDRFYTELGVHSPAEYSQLLQKIKEGR